MYSQNLAAGSFASPKIIESEILVFDNVFKKPEWESFVYLVEKWESRFVETETGDDNVKELDKSKRDSLVLFDFEPIYSFLRVQLYKYAFLVEKQLGYKMQLDKGFECQLTAHNDKHFYTAHTDFNPGTGTKVSEREITFVYYFHREPKSFEGGELFLWDHLESDAFPLPRADQGKYIEPKNNRLIIFPSKYWHEVRPISCPSKAFMDSRFTLNGWFHKS
ncbi:MAG TPA: 2OG-Fe(II) oxygenase [Vampirovibrionales bacterium]